MVFSCQTIVFMHDPTIEAFLRITESCTGVNSSLWLRWSTVNSDRARRVMFSNARSSCLVDKVIKQKAASFDFACFCAILKLIYVY